MDENNSTCDFYQNNAKDFDNLRPSTQSGLIDESFKIQILSDNVREVALSILRIRQTKAGYLQFGGWNL